jgi:urease accessory protein
MDLTSPQAASWRGHLHLHYQHQDGRTTALDRHDGPLRVLQRLYPEGPGICHHVLVHPPGGIVGGDQLQVEIEQDAGTHALITTPSATRFYRSNGAVARQQVHARLAPGARLEWLPLETLAYSACIAENQLRFDLAPGASMLGWDMLALGLPTAQLPFERGSLLQHLELPGVWLERGRIAADDTLLLQAPLGLAGHSVMGTLWCAAGEALPDTLRSALLDSARELMAAHPLAATAGATSPDAQVVVCRALAHRVEPLFELFKLIRARWRAQLWQLDAAPPRIWAM